MALIQTTPPSTEPVSVAELKAHLRIPDSTSGGTTAEDSMIGSFIKVARHQAEHYMERQICDATWQLIMDDFPGSTGHIQLYRPPISTDATEITITYTDTALSTQTVPSTHYVVDYKSQPPRIYPSYGNDWSTFSVVDAPDALRIQYVSGYSSSGNSTVIPDSIKTWIMMKAGMLYEYREPVSSDQFRTLPREHFNGLLDPFVVLSLST